MGIAERRIRQKAEVRTAILAEAWKLVREEGWQALSIRRIADAIEYSVPVVYDHFENKEAILSVFRLEGFRLLAAHLAAAKARHRKPALQMEAIAYAYWEFAFEHKAHYQIMYGLGMPACEHVKSLPEIAAFTAVIESTIAAIAAEAGTDVNLVMKTHSFWSMIHGLVSINLMTPPDDALNRMVLKDFISGFIRGLL